MVQLPIVHWNDVYRVRPQKIDPTSSETIDSTQFAALLDDIRDKWPDRSDGKKDGLSLFSGDVFAPSVESSVTRGSHMVPVMNQMAPDLSMLGNHDFDFGYPHLSKLIKDTKFPWLLSNIVDNTTSQVPEHVYEFQVVERAGVRIGIIALVEKEWIGTVSSWPSNFEYRDAAEVAMDLSRKLRDPDGQYKCDLIIALTHARVPNDVSLAKELKALTPRAQDDSFVKCHGVDIIFGGHDHLYFVGKGVDSWENYDLNSKVLGGEDDKGDVLIVKSGTDFRDLSELSLEIENVQDAGAVRKKVIRRATGIHHEIKPGMRSCEKLQQILGSVLQSVDSSLGSPLCKLATQLDVRSQFIRVEESASGNWFADILRHTYDDALYVKGVNGGADGVFICAGMLRGDSVYGPGYLTMGDVLEILPFEDPLVVIEVDGQTLWDTLEASLQTWPAQEGRFPVISGFRVKWDSRKPPGQRVLDVRLQEEIPDDAHHGDSGSATPSGFSTPMRTVDGDPIKRERGGRMYKIVTREYMAQGHDGFLPFKNQKYLIDDESGQVTSTIVRKYLLGAQFINKLARMNNSQPHLHPDTHEIVASERDRQQKHHAKHKARRQQSNAEQNWVKALSFALHVSRSKKHYRDHINVSAKEHMSAVDCFDGEKVRKMKHDDGPESDQEEKEGRKPSDEDMLVAHPTVDGRLRDIGRE